MIDSTACERLSAVDAHVVSNSRICREHLAIEIVTSIFPRSVPGQFLQLRCADDAIQSTLVMDRPKDGFPSLTAPDWHERQVLLRRPFSVADRWNDADGHVHLKIISHRVGPGTDWLERLRPGALLNITGPLGRGFYVPPQETALILVGGGVGIPPLLYLARQLHEARRRDVTMILGAASHDLLPVSLSQPATTDGTPRACVELPGDANCPTMITTDDGSAGLSGLVTDGLKVWQQRRSADQRGGLVFACGPEPMLRAIAQLTRQLGLDCQLCIERKMGCGLGACLSCVVRRRDMTKPDGWRWALACQDGPVFDRAELLDYDLPAGP